MNSPEYYLLCKNSQEIVKPAAMLGKQAWTNASYARTPVLIEPVPCVKCGKYPAGARWGAPYVVDLEFETGEAGDMCFGSGELFVSEKFIQVWEHQGLTGLSGFEKAEIRKIRRLIRRKPVIVPTYYHVNVAQPNIVFDRVASGVVSDTSAVCPVCNMGGAIAAFRRIALKLEGNQQSAPDIFRAKGLPGSLIVSSNFYTSVVMSHLSNIVVVPASCATVDYYKRFFAEPESLD